MNNHAFGATYCEHYDLLYNDKDYESECDLLEEVFRRYGSGPVVTILDLGCGTGCHALCLAQRGYRVTGVDCAQEMLGRAKEKVASARLAARCVAPAFHHGDLREIDLGQQFDAVLMMFSVLGYQLTDEDVSAALRTVRSQLRQDGLFVCDVWYGPAVLRIRPSDRVKTVPSKDGQVIRLASGSLDVSRQLVEVHYHIQCVCQQQLLSKDVEIHKVRYFFPEELASLMEHERLELVAMRAFGDLELEPSEDTWNVLVVGRAA